MLCEGDEAKQLFIREGGLDALLGVASRPFVQPRVLAAVCTGLLNLSSCVPEQVSMANRCMRLLLHINSQYSGLNGYSVGGSTLIHAAASPRGPMGLFLEDEDEESYSLADGEGRGRGTRDGASTLRSAEAKDRPDTNAVSDWVPGDALRVSILDHVCTLA